MSSRNDKEHWPPNPYWVWKHFDIKMAALTSVNCRDNLSEYFSISDQVNPVLFLINIKMKNIFFDHGPV